MKVKYQGGPMKGQYQEIQETYYSDRINVQGVDPVDIKKAWHPDDRGLMVIKRGEYARSNKRLKNGAVIYIWMGWVE